MGVKYEKKNPFILEENDILKALAETCNIHLLIFGKTIWNSKVHF